MTNCEVECQYGANRYSEDFGPCQECLDRDQLECSVNPVTKVMAEKLRPIQEAKGDFSPSPCQTCPDDKLATICLSCPAR